MLSPLRSTASTLRSRRAAWVSRTDTSKAGPITPSVSTSSWSRRPASRGAMYSRAAGAAQGGLGGAPPSRVPGQRGARRRVEGGADHAERLDVVVVEAAGIEGDDVLAVGGHDEVGFGRRPPVLVAEQAVDARAGDLLNELAVDETETAPGVVGDQQV